MSPEVKLCPRCGKKFECNNYNIFKCACVQVPLTADIRQQIAEEYDDCLCLECLKAFAGKSADVKS